MPTKSALFLFLLLSLTLTNVNSSSSRSGSKKSTDDDDNNNEPKPPPSITDDEQTIQIVIAASPDSADKDKSGGEDEDGGGGGTTTTSSSSSTAVPSGHETKRLKFVLDKQILFNSFQQSPVDPIGATSGFRGTVGKRNTDVPGDWAYEEEEEGDGDSTELEGEHNLKRRKEALENYNTAMRILYPQQQQQQQPVQTSPSLQSTSIYIRTSVGKTPQVTNAFKYIREAAPHHHESRELLAYAHLLGSHGVQFSIPEAYNLFKNLSYLGYPNSQFAIGFLSAYGLINKLDASKAVLHYTFGSISGSAFSSMALGYRYWGGIGVQASCERALEQYRTVAAIVASEVSEAGVGPAIQRVRLLDELEGDQRGGGSSASGSTNVLNSDILDYYTMLAERGDTQAQVGLGQLHFQGGRGISPDHHLALRYFQRAADAGSPVAMAFLGKMYLEGNDAVEPDYNLALRWFQRAAEQGSPVGQSGLGLMYLNGKGLPRDPSRALQYFTLAAEQGWVDGQLQLGNMYVSGIGVRRDYNLAAKYYNLAAQSGHILAIYNLAQMHATGTGMMRSCTAAVELYKSVAERGRWGLLLTEAYTAYQEKRYSNALTIYLLLSELGYEAAQSNAAFMLERGEIGEEIYALLNSTSVTPTSMLSKALQQWARSASQGYSPARVRLGDYYYYGWGTQKDYANAATQYRIASETNRNSQAMFNLAYMHENGLGLKQDLHLAKRFYDMSAETSNDAKVPVALALIKLQLISYFKGVGLLGESPTDSATGAGGIFDFVKDVVDNNDEERGSSNSKSSSGSGSSSSNNEDSSNSEQQFDEYWDLYLITVLIGLLGLLLYGRHDRRALQQQVPPPQ